MKKLLSEAIQQAIKELYSVDQSNFIVDFPTDIKFGDYSTNVALSLSKQLKKNPNEIANDIAAYLKVHASGEFSQKIATVNVVGGFINFGVTDSYLWDFVQSKVITFDESPKEKRIIVEYGQPNTHKLPHVGHLFSYVVGDSFARMLQAVGNIVMKANYEGDVGPHVAKSLYGYIQVGQPKPEDPLERVKLLQKCYQEGSKAYEEDPVAKETIDGINKKIYQKDPEMTKLWEMTRQWSVDYYQQFEQRLDVQQAYHYWESEIWEKGKEVVKANIGKVFEESEGAIVFPGEKYGLHTRVFLTKNDTPTYEAKDMGLNTQKYEDWPYDLNLITTASEQNAYFDVIIKALELCEPKLEGKVKHIGFGMVSLSTGKMSSRTGQILSAIDLIEEIKAKVAEIINKREGITTEEKEDIAEKVAMAAVKFTFLRQNILQNMKFDIQEAVNFEGRTGPYLLYTYARIQSILRQLEMPEATSKDGEVLTEAVEKTLMRWLVRFPIIVQEAASTLAPHLVAEYTYQLAQYFNSFYTSCPVNTAPTDELKRARRTLAKRTAQIIQTGLQLLGIKTVEKM